MLVMVMAGGPWLRQRLEFTRPGQWWAMPGESCIAHGFVDIIRRRYAQPRREPKPILCGIRADQLSARNNEAVAGAHGASGGNTLRLLIGDLSGGFIATLIAIPHAMGLGLLAFAALGPAWAPVGVVAGLLACVVGSFTSGVIPAGACMMMGPRTSVTMVFAGILAVLAAHPLLQTPQGPDVPQVLTLAFIAVFLSGLLQMGFGALRLGRAIKFVPYPVIAGFMNGIAILMIVSQIGPMLGMDGSLPLGELVSNAGAIRPASLLVTAVVIATIFLAPRVTRKVPVLLCGLLAGMLLHVLIAWRAPGAVGPLVGELPLTDFAPRELVSIMHLSVRDDFPAWLALLLPSALLMAAVSALDGLLAAVVTDPVTRSRHDSDRLLKGQGAAAMLAAAFGAVPAVASTHTRAAGYRGGGRSPRCALFHALFMLLSLFVLGPLIARVPVAALAGVIIYTALTLVDRWTHDLVRRLGADGIDRREILLNLAVVLGVTLSMLVFNLMAAFAVGIAAAIFLLLVKLSGSPVRRVLDGTVRASLKVRSAEERAMLRPLGRHIRIFELEGAIFFGTADSLQMDVESLPDNVRYVIIDFRRVTEVDASGARALETICHTAARRGMQVLLSHLRGDEGHGRYLRALGVAAVVDAERWFTDLDRALEWAEDRLLERERFEDGPELALRDMALFAGLDDEEMAVLTTLLERQELAHGDTVFREGDAGDRLYLIARGSVSIKVQLTDENRARRLATFTPGVFFGEMAMIEGEHRSADAFAKGECVVLFALSAERLAQIVQLHPQLGIKLYRNLSRELATRLRATSGALRALE
jgi:SulP family sulfate permease